MSRQSNSTQTYGQELGGAAGAGSFTPSSQHTGFSSPEDGAVETPGQTDRGRFGHEGPQPGVRKAGIWLLPASGRPVQAGPSFPAFNNSPHDARAAARNTQCWLFRQVEGGLSGHLEAGEGKKKSRRRETTQGDRAQSPPQPSAATSHAAPETDRHRFSKAQPVR